MGIWKGSLACEFFVWVGCIVVGCLSIDISVHLGFYAKCNRLEEHDRRTRQCLAGTMERPHTSLLYSKPFFENNVFMYWLIVIESP